MFEIGYFCSYKKTSIIVFKLEQIFRWIALCLYGQYFIRSIDHRYSVEITGNECRWFCLKDTFLCVFLSLLSNLSFCMDNYDRNLRQNSSNKNILLPWIHMFLDVNSRRCQYWIKDFPGGTNHKEVIRPNFPESCMKIKKTGPRWTCL